MRLSPSERQVLVGPLVVGCIFGAFVAYASFAFASEYGSQGNVNIWWLTAGDAAFGFLGTVLSIVGVWGVLPILAGRFRSKQDNNA